MVKVDGTGLHLGVSLKRQLKRPQRITSNSLEVALEEERFAEHGRSLQTNLVWSNSLNNRQPR